VLLVRHRLVKGLQSNANSSLYNYSMLSSLVSSHFSGACRGVALALLLTIPVGFEAVMDEVASPPEDSESESDQEDEDGVMLVGRSSKQQRQYRRRHTRSNDFAARPTTVSGFTPLYDGFSRVSEMQQLLVDTATTLKHVCGLH
jgi:Na+/H+ antiporter NhaB